MDKVVTITSLALQETGSYNPMYERSLQSDINGMVLDEINERISNVNSTKIGEAVVSGFANNAISPASTPGHSVTIPNGWEERRIRFVLQATVSSRGTEPCIYIFQGFTDHIGISMGGKIDPNMRLYVNSYIRINRVPYNTNAGIEWADSVVESAHVINDQLVMDSYDGFNGQLFSARPSDIFSAIQSSYLEAGYNIQGQQQVPFNDSRIIYNDTITSNRGNGNPSTYMTNILNSYKTGLNLTEYGQNNTEVLDRSTEVASMAEGVLRGNPLFRNIASLRGYGTGSNFTFQELNDLCPNLGDITTVLMTGGDHSMIHLTGQSCYWNTATRDAQMANAIGNAVPAIMIESFLGSVIFRATNLTRDMTPEVQVISSAGMANGLEVIMVNRFIEAIKIKLLMNITNGTNEGYTMVVHCSMFNDTSITLTLDGQAEVTYVVPTFCDSLLTPMINNNKPSHYNLVNEVETLLESTRDSLLATPAG